MNQQQETQISQWVGRALAAGVIASSLLMLAGLVLVFLRHELRPQSIHPDPASLIPQMLAGQGTAFLEAGLLVLMITPFVRVAVLAGGWLMFRQWRLAAIAGMVLLLLLTGLCLGVA